MVRPHPSDTVLYTFDQFVLDTDRFEISKNGCPLHAEPQVIEL